MDMDMGEAMRSLLAARLDGSSNLVVAQPSAPLPAMALRLNLFIAAAFAVNFVVAMLSQFGIVGKTNAEVAREYQSLATPAGWAFAIWGVIFPLQLVYSAAQLAVPSLREADEVQVAGPWFVGTCLLQAAWELSFGFEQIYMQLVFIVLVLITLVQMIAALRALAIAKPPTWGRTILFHLPFGIHCGWLTAASAVSANLTVVFVVPSAHAALLAFAVASLTAVFVPAFIKAISARTTVDATYALTVGWALAGVASQLSAPSHT